MSKAQQKQNKKFWNFIPAADNKSPELELYGDIASETWWGDEVTPKQFTKELTALGEVEEIIVRINSGGGDVFAANAIYTRLKDNSAKITVKIDGWAASAATIVAMAGDTIEIPANGVFMVHDPKMGVLGFYSEKDFVKLSEELKVIKQSIINGYALKTGKDETEIAAIMSTEKWYDGKQAVEAGFCDKLMFEEVETGIENASKIIVNSVPIDISHFDQIPTALLNRFTPHTPDDFSNKNNEVNRNNKVNKHEKENKDMDIKTVDELRTAFPDFTAQIAKEATDAERKRIKDIEGVALAGFENIVDEAKFTKPIAAGELATAIIAQQKKQGTDYLENRNNDAKNSGANAAGTAGIENPKNNNSDEANVDDMIDKLYPKTK